MKLKLLAKKEILVFILGMGIIIYSNWVMCIGIALVCVSAYWASKKM